MQNPCSTSRDHYDRFLADHYLWMAGGFRENANRNRAFFQDLDISPARTDVALDLGAGCGFQAVPLADRGFRVTAIDISRPMLDELRHYDPDRRIEIIHGDITDFSRWTGRSPELITCMGDTLTHLMDPATVRSLFRQCHTELVPGGTLILSFRDYSREPDGTIIIIPVRRDETRIFLCRLIYDRDQVQVADIIFSRTNGIWERLSGTYRKIRLGPSHVQGWLENEGLDVTDCKERDGMMTIVAVRS